MRRLWQFLAWGVLVLFSGAAIGAECAQITTWSSADASAFPVPRVTRVDRSNTPGPFYFQFNEAQEKTLLVTYLALTATPSLTRDQQFSNAVVISLSSFAREADAQTMYGREILTFTQLNPIRWGYKVLPTDTGAELVYYDDTAGSREINFMYVKRNVLVRIRLDSAFPSETVLSTGVSEMRLRATQVNQLVDAKCGLPPTGGTAPTVTLTTSRGSFSQAAFQRDLAAGKFTLTASHPLGVHEIDWASFRLLVEGVDKTANLLRIVGGLPAQRIVYTETLNTASYALQLDPAKLEGEHNLFNIAWNGWWSVSLRLCDRYAVCGQSDYRLYFGPFLDVDSFADTRCGGPSTGADGPVILVSYGNHGYRARSHFLIALGTSTGPWTSWTRNYWSLSLDVGSSGLVFRWYDDAYGLLPVLFPGPMDIASGSLVKEMRVATPSVFLHPPGTTSELAAGSYTLVHGAMDLGVINTPYWSDSRSVTLCARR